MWMGSLWFFWPLVVGASFIARTAEVDDPQDAFHLLGPDGKIDQVILTFDQNIQNVFVEDFEVRGYRISNATFSNADVTLNLVNGDVQDTGAKPVVKFFPGRLKYTNTGGVVYAGYSMINQTATDGCAPVWDLSTGTSSMLAPQMDSSYSPVDTISMPASFFVSFSEKVNLALAPALDPGYNLCAPTNCSASITWNPVDGPLTALSHAMGTNFCPIGSVITDLGLASDNLPGWGANVQDLAAQTLRIRKPTNLALMSFHSQGSALPLGFSFNDTMMNYCISTPAICSRSGIFTNCTTNVPVQPRVIASSWDLDGNGKIDTIQVLTKQYRLDMTAQYSLGETLLTRTTTKTTRALADTLVSSTQSLWSLPGYTITGMVQERGRVLLSVNETTVDTSPITSLLTYSGTLTSWTGNTLNATAITVGDRACPTITGVKGTGGSNQVYIYFSENVSTSINSTMFIAIVGTTFTVAPFVNGGLNESSVFVGNLSSPLIAANFGPTAQLSISGLASITQPTGGCIHRRNYVPLTKLDTTPPNITQVFTRDFNGNGKIDGVSVIFSERVSDASVNAAQFSFDGLPVTYVASALDDNIVDFTVAEYPTINTTATYLFAANSMGFLTDLSENIMAAQTMMATDGVGPYPLSARTGSNPPTSFDPSKVIMTFSEPVFNVSISDFTVTNPAGVTLTSFSLNGASVTLSFTAAPLPWNANLTINFVRSTNLQDTLGNLAPNFTTIAVDGAPPQCGDFVAKAPITEDTNNNGHIDRISLNCGEAVKGGGVGSYLIANYTVLNVSAATITCPGGYSNCVQIYVQEKSDFDTGVTPAVAYTASPALTDMVGNPLFNTTFTLTDKTPPVLVRILTQDTNADGKIDLFRLEFSESMLSGVGYEGAWSIPNYIISTFTAISGTTFLELTASANGGVYDGGATPSVTVGANGVRDSSSNFLGARNNVICVDGVLPIVLGTYTAGSCKLDRIKISMNENINISSVNLSSFAIPGYNITNPIAGGVTPFGFSLQVASYPSLTPDLVTPIITYNASFAAIDNGGNALAAFSRTTVDQLNPCFMQCSGHVGGSYVAVTFSEPVSTGPSNTSLGQSNFQLNASSVSLNGVSVNSTSSYQLNLTAPFVESDINFNGADTFALVGALNIHDTSNLNVLNFCYVLNDDLTPPTLRSVVTVNSDTDAMIDRIMLTFDEAVKDSTFNVSHWNVSGYTITGLSTGTVANDGVFYLTLAIKTVPDTGAKPTVTYTKPAFGGASDRNRNLLNSTSMVAIDGAAPVLVSFRAIILSPAQGGNIAIATFSEPVTGVNGSVLNSSNFVYNSSNGGASSIQSFLDADALSDQIATMRLNSLTLADFANDVVVALVWDQANLSSTNWSVFVTKGDTVPPVVLQATTADLNADGHIDHLMVMFNESMLDTSFNISTFSLAPYTLVNLTVNDSVVSFFVNGSVGLDGNATPSFNYTAGAAADLNGNLLQNFARNATDGVKPFLVDCSSTLPNIHDIQCQFSESVTAMNSDFAIGGPLLSGSATITGPTVASSGQVITIQLSRSLVLSDFKQNGTVDLSPNTTVVDVANNHGLPRAVYLRNTDVTPPNATGAFTRDRDCDGYIDAIEIIFDEGVIDSNVIPSEFTVGGGFVFNGSVTGVANDNSIFLDVQKAGSPNTDAGNFNLVYTPGNLTDLSENKAAAFTLNVQDGAGVALVSVTGTVDQPQVYLTFSAPITAVNTISQFQLLNFSSQINVMADSDGTDSNVSFMLTSALLPRDFIQSARVNPLVLDADGNTACGVVRLTNPDKTLPTVVSITTADENGDGYIDSFIVNCSKPIDETSLKITDFSVSNYTITNKNSTGLPRNVFKLIVAQKNGTVDAAATPQVSYTAGSLTDRYGNFLASFSNRQSVDGAGPAIISATGSGSTLTLVFSKPIYNSTNGNGTTFKLTDITYHASGNGTSANALNTILDRNGADGTLSFAMAHAFTAAEYSADTVSSVSASIFDSHGNPASPVPVKIVERTAVAPPAEEGATLTETEIILIGAVGGGGLLLLIIAVIAVVVIKKKGGCCKKKEAAFDQNQIANEFDFGSAGSTEMTQSSKGAQRLEA